MIVTFCGHSQFIETEKYKKHIFDILEERVGDDFAQMYLGGYGGFDDFAYVCCKKYKEKHPNTSLVFVTPYITEEYQRNRLNDEAKRYDLILYPPIEDKPKRFSISYRNKYMVDAADLVIAYIDHNFGGAYKTYDYAKRKGKDIFNLADNIK